MPLLDHKRLRRLHEACAVDAQAGRCSPHQFFADFREALQSGQIKLEELSFQRLWDEFVPNGAELRRCWETINNEQYGVAILEAAGSVNSSAFSAISGQMLYHAVMNGWDLPGLIGESLVETIPTTELDGEKIPGIGNLADLNGAVGESEPYPMVGMTEEYIDTPVTEKRGSILTITQEVIQKDKTGLVLRRAQQLSETLRMNKEKRLLDLVTGITTSYRYKGAAAVATYADSSASHPFDNLAATNALVDYTDIQAAMLLFDAMSDPVSGEPIMSNPNTILYPTALEMAVRRALNATEIRQGAVDATTPLTVSPNPLQGRNFSLMTNQYVSRRTSSSSTWFIGDFKKAFAYMQVMPIGATPMPPNTYLGWTHDIIAGFKVNERGVGAVKDPRHVVKCTA